MSEAPDRRMRGRQQEFIGPRRRSRIIRLVATMGQWNGRRGPMSIQIRRDRQPTLEGAEISFHASIYREGISGQAGTVAEAIEKLEGLYRDRTLEVRRIKERKTRKKKETNQQ
jgi:hypothetical protein